MSFTGQLILAYHGCDQSVKEKVLSGKGTLKPSTNLYDWLGHGIYFWESDPLRALEFARECKRRKTSNIKIPSVVGVVLNLRSCLDLLQRENIKLLQRSYEGLKAFLELKGEPLPQNKKTSRRNEFLLRNLDCAVINYLHDIMEVEGKSYDSVRAALWEGDCIYENSGFREFSHIQICIRNYDCILGYFDPSKWNQPLEIAPNNPIGTL